VQNHGSTRVDRLLHSWNIDGRVVLTDHITHDALVPAVGLHVHNIKRAGSDRRRPCFS
jgi:hypothetical protein